MDELEQESINQELMEFAVQESLRDVNKSAKTSRFDPGMSNSATIFTAFKELSNNSTSTKNIRPVCSPAALGRSHTVKRLPR